MSTTLNQILPGSRLSGENVKYWDYSSIANVARSILECCLIFHYLAVADVDEEEWRDRINLMHLHDATARVALFRTLLPDEDQVKGLEEQRAEVRARLENSPRIKVLPEGLQKKLLNGERMSFEIQDETLNSMGKDVEKFRAWYKVLSAHTNSLPFAFHRALDGTRGTGVEPGNEKRWATFTLDFLLDYLSASLSGMLRLFPDIPDPRLQKVNVLRSVGPVQ